MSVHVYVCLGAYLYVHVNAGLCVCGMCAYVHVCLGMCLYVHVNAGLSVCVSKPGIDIECFIWSLSTLFSETGSLRKALAHRFN